GGLRCRRGILFRQADGQVHRRLELCLFLRIGIGRHGGQLANRSGGIVVVRALLRGEIGDLENARLLRVREDGVLRFQFLGAGVASTWSSRASRLAPVRISDWVMPWAR